MLKPALDRLYAEYDDPASAADPIHIVRRFPREDQEIVGFVAAALAFGRVASILQSIERVVAVMGDHPAAYVRAFEPRRDRRAFAGFVHRWTDGADAAALVWVLRQMLDRAGSLEAFFVEGDRPDAEDVGEAIERFSTRALALDVRAVYGQASPRPGVGYFFARPSSGSACKRMNLFLRWMVRRDALDLGVWTRVDPSRLIVPLDTHIVRVGRCLGLTRYQSPGWSMARDITSALRRIDRADPVKYDFALCHLGMMDRCGFGEPQRDARCPLSGVCRPGAGRRPPSRRPSAPR
jgi:uncharacterized protein (TIGR02757 family)